MMNVLMGQWDNLCLCVVLLITLNTEQTESIVIHPDEITVTKGQSIRFNCTADSDGGVEWKLAYVGSFGQLESVYGSNQISEAFAKEGRYRVESPGSNSRRYDLLIDSVELHDAGTYYCIDGSKQQAKAVLTVLDDLKDQPVVPEDTVARIGSVVVLRCATQYSIPVYWLHLPIGKTVRVPVYYGSNRGFPNGYGLEGRHSIDSATAGHYDLVISYVKLSDAGSYTCIDKAGQGKSSSAQLSVIESVPVCAVDGVQPSNVCGIATGGVTLSCEVKYRGNLVPRISWVDEHKSEVVETCASAKKESYFNMSSCSVAIDAEEETHWSEFTCEVAGYECKPRVPKRKTNPSSVIQGTAHLKAKDDVWICTAPVKNPESCIYTWIALLGSSNKTAAVGRQLHTSEELPGKYICKAECESGNSKCIAVSPAVDIESTDPRSPPSDHHDGGGTNRVITIFFFLLCLMFVVILSIGCWLRRKKIIGFYRDQRRRLRSGPTSQADIALPLNKTSADSYFDEEAQSEAGMGPKRSTSDDNQQCSSVLVTTKTIVRANSGDTGSIISGIYQSMEVIPLTSETKTGQRNNNNVEQTLLEEGMKLMGVTFLESIIYVVYSECQTISAYSDKAPFDRLIRSEFVIRDIKVPDDMTSCAACRSVFVSDYSDNKCIWKIRISDKKTSRIEVNGKPSRMSTTASDELLVIVRGDTTAFLEIFKSSDGSHLRLVNFSDEIQASPKVTIMAVKTPKGCFSVLHKTPMSDNSGSHRYFINETGYDGEVTKTFDLTANVPTSKQDILGSHMAEDGYGRVFVADSNNSRVYILNSKLTQCKTLVSVADPYRLCYVKDKQLLIVGQWSPACLSIIRLNKQGMKD